MHDYSLSSLLISVIEGTIISATYSYCNLLAMTYNLHPKKFTAFIQSKIFASFVLLLLLCIDFPTMTLTYIRATPPHQELTWAQSFRVSNRCSSQFSSELYSSIPPPPYVTSQSTTTHSEYQSHFNGSHNNEYRYGCDCHYKFIYRR